MDSSPSSRPAPYRVRIGISSCLLGESVRHDGGHKRAQVLIATLGGRVDWVPVCPEVEAGMGVPREPVQLVAGEGKGIRMVGTSSGADWTGRMRELARRRLEELRALGLSGYVLKSRSPSCGLAAALHAAGGAEPIPGRSEPGLFAAALRRACPTLPVEEETSLLDESACELFLERALEYHLGQRERIRRCSSE